MHKTKYKDISHFLVISGVNACVCYCPDCWDGVECICPACGWGYEAARVRNDRPDRDPDDSEILSVLSV